MRSSAANSSQVGPISGPRKLEIIPGVLDFLCVDDNFDMKNASQHSVHFTTDKELLYTAFFADFGPLNLGLTYKFCQKLDMLLTESRGQRVVYYSSTHPHRKANSAVLLCAYMIFVRNYSVEEAYRPFLGMEPPFCTFRDAAFGVNTYPITVLDCARAFHRAVTNMHFVYSSFSLEKFERLSKLENGDISWIIPDKFIAFSGPLSTKREVSNGVFTLLPHEYVPIFKSLGVTCIIRFNNKCYDRKVFLKAGIRHVDLFYEDGGNPTESILQSFLQICERESGAIAVHCKAGLGRTGTNIAAYMIKHYGYTVKESIAWCRVCRPGSVVGPQQQYLAQIEKRMMEEGARYRQDHQQQLMQSSDPKQRRGSSASGERRVTPVRRDVPPPIGKQLPVAATAVSSSASFSSQQLSTGMKQQQQQQQQGSMSPAGNESSDSADWMKRRMNAEKQSGADRNSSPDGRTSRDRMPPLGELSLGNTGDRGGTAKTIDRPTTSENGTQGQSQLSDSFGSGQHKQHRYHEQMSASQPLRRGYSVGKTSWPNKNVDDTSERPNSAGVKSGGNRLEASLGLARSAYGDQKTSGSSATSLLRASSPIGVGGGNKTNRSPQRPPRR